MKYKENDEYISNIIFIGLILYDIIGFLILCGIWCFFSWIGLNDLYSCILTFLLFIIKGILSGRYDDNYMAYEYLSIRSKVVESLNKK